MKALTLIAALLTSCAPAYATPFVSTDCLPLTQVSTESRLERGDVREHVADCDIHNSWLKKLRFAHHQGESA